jgi:hypothetical protein
MSRRLKSLVSEGQKRATLRYNRRKYDQLLVRLPKGQADLVRQRAANSSFRSFNAYLLEAIETFGNGLGDSQPSSRPTSSEPGLFLHFTETELANITKLAGVFRKEIEDCCKGFILRNVAANAAYLK